MNTMSFADFLPYVAMIRDGCIVCQDLSLIRTFQFVPKDLEFIGIEEIENLYRTLYTAFQFLEENWGIQSHSFRRELSEIPDAFDSKAPAAAKRFNDLRVKRYKNFYSNSYFITFQYLIPEKSNLKKYMFTNTDDSDSINDDVSLFMSQTDSIYDVLSGCCHSIKKLDSSEQLTFLHMVYSDSHPVRFNPDYAGCISQYLADVTYCIPGATVLLNTGSKIQNVLTASVRGFVDDKLKADVVSDLMSLPAEFMLSTKFEMLSPAKARKMLARWQRFWERRQKRLGKIVAEAITGTSTEDGVNAEAVAHTGKILQSIADLADGESYGYFSAAVVVRDEIYDNARKKLELVVKELNRKGIVTQIEYNNNPATFFSSFPGSPFAESFLTRFQSPRKYPLTVSNFLAFFPMSEMWRGEFTNSHLKRVSGIDFPTLIGVSENSPFFYTTNVDDVEHVIYLGRTNSGKSILLQTVLTQLFRYPEMRFVFFDKDKSSQFIINNLGGDFYDIGEDSCQLRFNPFSHILDINYRLWFASYLADFFRLKGVNVTAENEGDISAALETMCSDPENLSFSTFRNLIQNRAMRMVCDLFVQGAYRNLFTDKPDNLGLKRLVGFEMNTLFKRDDAIASFIYGYLFNRVKSMFRMDGPPGAIFIDEGSFFLAKEFLAREIVDGAKTLRKMNVGIHFATQSLSDLEKSPYCDQLNDCFLTKICVANPKAGEFIHLYKKFGLGDDDIVALSRSLPARDYLFVNEKGRQIFSLNLCPDQLSLLKSFQFSREEVCVN